MQCHVQEGVTDLLWFFMFPFLGAILQHEYIFCHQNITCWWFLTFGLMFPEETLNILAGYITDTPNKH